MKGGVVGLGAKGFGMGQTLLADGHAVAGFDLTADAVARRVALGGRPAGSLAMAVQNADVVVCVGVTTSQTKAVPFGPKGAAAVMAPRRRDPVLRHHGPKVMATKSWPQSRRGRCPSAPMPAGLAIWMPRSVVVPFGRHGVAWGGIGRVDGDGLGHRRCLRQGLPGADQPCGQGS